MAIAPPPAPAAPAVQEVPPPDPIFTAENTVPCGLPAAPDAELNCG